MTDTQLLSSPIPSFPASPIAEGIDNLTINEKPSRKDEKPSFNYDLDLFNLTKKYLDTKNRHGLALIARQRGIPPFLRFKIWPLLLKYHPFVLNPFIQPDHDISNDYIEKEKTSTESNESEIKDVDFKESNSVKVDETESKSRANSTSKSKSDDIKAKIKKDLSKYIQRLKYSANIVPSSLELEIFEILEKSILKFSLKWGKIVKYDQSLTWIALNLAEWFPPLQNTPWVLVGRDHQSINNLFITNFMDDYSNYIDNIPHLKEYLEELVQESTLVNMSFHDVYERLVLVLLHSPEDKRKRSNSVSDTQSLSKYSSPKKLNKTILPISGGTIEERVSFFIYCLRKLLPELSDYFHEEQILNKFGSHDDEWLIWWLNYCGSKVWSKYDRGRIWDKMLGWRLKNPKKDMEYYVEKMDLMNCEQNLLSKLGPDIFWSLSSNDDFDKSLTEAPEYSRRNSFKDLVNELNSGFESKGLSKRSTNISTDGSSSASKSGAHSPSSGKFSFEGLSETGGISTFNPSDDGTPSTIPMNIPFSKLDSHIELIFISLAFLKSKENVLVELDQHEIRQFLSRLPSKSYNYKHQQKSKCEPTCSNENSATSSVSSSPTTTASPFSMDAISPTSSTLPSSQPTYNNIVISNDSTHNHKVNFMDNIINEAGELWRKWLWLEMVDDN